MGNVSTTAATTAPKTPGSDRRMGMCASWLDVLYLEPYVGGARR